MLQRRLETNKETSESCLTDKAWQKRYQRYERKRNPKFNISDELERINIDLQISTKILGQCVRSGERDPIYLTKEQWDWLDKSVHDMERQCLCCKKVKSLSEIFNTSFFCKKCTDKGIGRCLICNEFRPISESIGDFKFCKECKEKELDEFDGCYCLLPNSKWLMDTLKWTIESGTGDGLADKILEQCAKTGENKLVSLSKVQCHWLYVEICWCADHPLPIAGGMPERRPGATYAKWSQSMNKYLELIDDELTFPSSTPPPSDEEWKKCSDTTNMSFTCVRCDKELEPRHLRVPMQLSVEQRKWLKGRLESEVKSQAAYNRSLLKGYTNINTRFALKLMNNAISILSTTPKNSMVLFDPYTISFLAEECERYLKEEPNILKSIEQGNVGGIPEGVDKNRVLEGVHHDLEMLNILLEMMREIEMEKLLCYQCIRVRESMKGV